MFGPCRCILYKDIDVLGPYWHIYLQHCSVCFQTNRTCTKKQCGDPLLSQTSQLVSIYPSELKNQKHDAVLGLLQLNLMADKTNKFWGEKKTVPTWITGSLISSMRLRFRPTQTHTALDDTLALGVQAWKGSYR